MFTFITLVVLGVLLGIVLMQLFKKSTPPPAPVADLTNLKVTDTRAGDALSISGAGDNYTDLDFTVDPGSPLRRQHAQVVRSQRSVPRTACVPFAWGAMTRSKSISILTRAS
ncbi:MAG: hypothetical protein WDO73_18770 [Ignavibacteriota bacterium]